MVSTTIFQNSNFEDTKDNALEIIELPTSVCFSINGVDVELDVDDVGDMINVLYNWLNKKI